MGPHVFLSVIQFHMLLRKVYSWKIKSTLSCTPRLVTEYYLKRTLKIYAKSDVNANFSFGACDLAQKCFYFPQSASKWWCKAVYYSYARKVLNSFGLMVHIKPIYFYMLEHRWEVNAAILSKVLSTAQKQTFKPSSYVLRMLYEYFSSLETIMIFFYELRAFDQNLNHNDESWVSNITCEINKISTNIIHSCKLNTHFHKPLSHYQESPT